MIISKTPYRISFFGGGTDYPTWYKRNSGAVISTTINKFCYISIRYLPQFFSNKNRLVWSKIEKTNNLKNIEHPAIKAALINYKLDKGIELHHFGDLPARSGMGSSSSFAVGLINSIYQLKKLKINKKKLAQEAIKFEQKILKEPVGIQDQIAASYGGFNITKISNSGSFNVKKIDISSSRKIIFNENLLLFFTGVSRFSGKFAAAQIKNTKKNKNELNRISQLTNHALNIFTKTYDFDAIGKILDESWMLKRELAKGISNTLIDEIYEVGKSNGALGGKLLGAGGGGFLLFYAKKKNHTIIKKRLSKLLHIPFKFENEGSKIIFS